jgi:4-alpha-glucanotransferase
MDTPLRSLRHLARAHGVQLDYTDPQGRLQVASPESLMAVLRALGCEITRIEHAATALVARRTQRWRRVAEPVHVAWDGRGGGLDVRLPAAAAAPRIALHLATESGETLDWEARFDAPPTRAARVNGEQFVLHRIALPPVLPPGYHRLRGEIGPHRFETLLIAAPQTAYRGDCGEPSWGAFMPLYALHSRNGMGCGDYGDLGALLRWVHELGGRTVGTLPILPAFLDECFEPSPYVPLSRLFWNEFFVDVTAAPELQQCEAARRVLESAAHAASVAALREAKLVDYAAVMRLRRAVLEPLARSFFDGALPARRAAYGRFLATRPGVMEYARFRAASETHRTPWLHWPAAERGGSLTAAIDLDRVQYHAYAQWLAHEQLGAAAGAGRGRGAGLYLDFPVGVSAIGFDTWRYRDSFALGTRVGAPPDTLFTQGQDWGFPPFHPDGLRDSGYAYLRSCLRHHMSIATHLRIDHVMGLHRLFWIPPDCDTPRGVYVCYQPEEMYAVLSLESHRARCALVGENLGIVPDRVERAMQRHALGRLYVMQFALYDGPEKLTPPAPDAVASLNTHDMPTFAAFWRGLDIDDRLDLGFINAEQAAAEHAGRADLRARFHGWIAQHAAPAAAGAGDGDDTGAALAACIDFLARSPAAMVLVALEDLWLETLPHNVPSTWRERPNWMRKSRYTLEELRALPEVKHLLRDLVLRRGVTSAQAIRPAAG